MAKPSFILRALVNNGNPQLNGSIGAGDTTLALKTGHGAKLPQPITGSASSTGTAQTLNDTGDLGSLNVGDFIENVTDGSFAIVLTAGTDSVKTTPLYGGSDNLWQSGDTWARDRAVCTLAALDVEGVITKSERILLKTRSTDSITVSRSFGGDTAQTFAADDYVYLFVEKTTMEEMQKAIRHMYMRIHESYLNSDRFVVAADTTGNAYGITLSPVVTDYNDIIGMPINVKSDVTTSGAATLNVNGLGAKNIMKMDGVTATASGDIATGQVFQVIYDGTNFQMQTYVNNNALTPTGVMHMWLTDTAPTGFLLCYGQAISRSTYSALFAVIGETYGVGDASTTFNLPDLRGRFPLGQDDMGGSAANRVTDADADTLGGADGAETVTLTDAQVPAQTVNVLVNSGGDSFTGDVITWANGAALNVASDTCDKASYTTEGGGGAHNNMPPFITVNYIIKT